MDILRQLRQDPSTVLSQIAAQVVVSEPLSVVDPVSGYSIEEADEPHAEPAPTIGAPAEVCPDCGCEFGWEDIAGRLHCCECRVIGSQRMVAGFWRLLVRAACPFWEPWSPTYWRPFAPVHAKLLADRASVERVHLDASEGF